MVKEKLVERGKWEEFYCFSHDNVNTEESNVWLWDYDDIEHWTEFNSWLFIPTRFYELAVEFLEGRK